MKRAKRDIHTFILSYILTNQVIESACKLIKKEESYIRAVIKEKREVSELEIYSINKW